MTTATKTRARKTAKSGPERTLHAVFGALETTGERIAQFAKQADTKLTRHVKKTPRKNASS